MIIALLIPLIGMGGWVKHTITLGAKAYVYGYPLVLMNATRKENLNQAMLENTLHHNQVFPDHNFRTVIRPNNDTLYSIAWLNLSDQPMILSVPDMKERYYVMPLMDAFTNVFASVGTRETGSQKGDYMISGPNWQGEVPQDVHHIKANSDIVWMVGRIQTDGVTDIPEVIKLQQQFALTPLSSFKIGLSKSGKRMPNRDSNRDIASAVNKLSTLEYLQRLGDLLQTTHTPVEDADLVTQLASIGLTPENGFNPTELNALNHWLISRGFDVAKHRLESGIKRSNTLENGWRVIRRGVGNYGSDYSLRAAVAMIGLGALPPKEASYPLAKIGADGKRLEGKHSYILHFDAGQLPPVDAFWSLALYDQNGYFIDNPIKRYSVSDRDQLELNDDGSLTIQIQHDAPTDTTNWLPSPQGEFQLTLRLYLPKDQFIRGLWSPPAVETKQ